MKTSIERQASNIIALKTPKRLKPKVAQHRFNIFEFVNRGGSKSWSVRGTKRNGERVRQNFGDKDSAKCRQIELETEWLTGEQPAVQVKATKLTDDQLSLAEAAFIALGPGLEHEMPLAIQHWIKEGRRSSVADSPLLDDALKKFNEWLDLTKELRPRTKSNLKIRVGNFVAAVGRMRVCDVTPETIDEFLATRRVAFRDSEGRISSKPVSGATKDNDRRAVSKFFSWCMDRQRRWCSLNPCHAVRVEKDQEDDAPEILTLEDCRNLLKASETHRQGKLAPYVALCLFGGLRPFEAARITWKQINLKDRQIRLESSQTKTKRGRVVEICDTLAAWLEAYKDVEIYPENWRRDFDSLRALAGFGNKLRLAKKEQEQIGKELKPWPDDVMRHTAISHYFRKHQSYGKTAEQFGNSEAIIKKHYQGRVSSEETKDFYAIRPMKG